jgi:GR25 family glycosyltransferase involved in LPS biosynthesis
MAITMNFDGFYINLDETGSRNMSMVAEIRKVEMSNHIRRFQAVKLEGGTSRLSPSEAGCLLSHYTIIKNSIASNKHLLVLEDDTIFPRQFADYLNLAIGNLDEQNDLLFFGSLFNYHDLIVIERWLSLIRDLKLNNNLKTPDKFFFLPAEHWYSAGGHCYLVNNSSKGKLENYVISSIQAGMNEAIDEIFLRGIKLGDIKAKVVFPFIVGINHNLESNKFERDSDIQQRLYNVSSNVFSVAVSYEEMLRDALFGTSEHENIHSFLFGNIAKQRLIPVSRN